jgi:hypothetical protein
VLIVISTQQPTKRRCRIGGLNISAAVSCGTGAAITGGGSVAPPEDSASIDSISASASAVRPCDSSQRGDSGKFLRRYQTTSEPTPAIMNIGRQPKLGMIR